jgi:endoglycosylceramidase
MSFHDYCSSNASTDPAGCSATEQRVVANALRRSAVTGNALLLSEFGATDDLSDLRRLVADADSNQVSWIEWAYCGCGDPTGTIPPSIEGLVSNARLAGIGSNVDEAKLAVLAEPYPRLTSGTPSSYSFDPNTHIFTFRFSTRSPSGREFGAGSCSAVVLPPFQFPHGYVVTATGATVTSKHDAGLLTVSQTGSSPHAVTVEIRPGTGGATAPANPASFAACT